MDWKAYEKAMKPARERAKEPPKKPEKPSGVRPTELFEKLVSAKS